MFHVKHIIKGVILDFNGTLYLDHDLNRKAWEDAFNSLKTPFSNAQYDDLDRTNTPNDYLLSKAIYRFFNIEASNSQINEMSEKKEKEYRDLARQLNRDTLINGTDKFLDYLKDNNIPYCIASMAPKSNFDFYLDYLHLNKWFTYNNIVYDNGQYNDKNSQILDAAKILGVDPKDCLIIEDTPSNIDKAIIDLKANKFIYMNTRQIEYNTKEIIQEINDYTELDYCIFNK